MFWTKYKRDRVIAAVRKYRKALLLTHWDVGIVFDEKKDPEFDAHVHPDNVYQKATITFHPGTWKNIDPIVKHELMHLVTEPMVDCSARLHRGDHVTMHEINHTCERVTDHITKILSDLG